MGSEVGDTTWLELQAAFRQALELPPPRRDEALRAAAARSPAFEQSLARLLTAHASPDSVLDRPPTVVSASEIDDADDTLIGQRIGNYLIMEAIGRGALGAVYRAMQEQPRRWVAIKLPRFSDESPDLLRRLEFEAETLGRLQHPCIAQIIEAGLFQRGDGLHPFIAMELIEGPNLSAFADSRHLSREARIRLLMRVCEGVQHAHQRGVIHLDLKPANILVMDEAESWDSAEAGADAPAPPSRGRPKSQTRAALPKILDFGIARWRDAGRRPDSPVTGSGGIVGTLAYMSPEQLLDSADAAGTRCDIYALGVIAFELLCGRLPIEIPPGLRSIESIEFARGNPRLSPREAAPDLPADLDAIIAKAMHRQPAERYSSAAELASDLQRHLNWEPVLARRATPQYLLGRFTRRHRALVGAAALAITVLVAALLGFAWKAREEARLRAAADARLEAEFATNSMVVEWIENGLADLPGSTRLRATLAETALHALHEMRAATPVSHNVSDEIDFSLAYAHQRLGEVRLSMGDAQSAHDAFVDSLAIRQRQAKNHPQPPRYRRALGVGYWKVADALLELGRAEEAREPLQSALALHELLRGTPGDPPTYDAVYLGLARQRLAIAAQRAGRQAEALEQFDLALAQFAAGLELDAGDIQLLRGKERSLRGRAAILAAVGREAEAVTALQEVISTCDHAIRLRGSAGVWERQQRAEALGELSELYRKSRQQKEAHAAWEEACRIAGELAGADPLRADFAELQRRLQTRQPVEPPR